MLFLNREQTSRVGFSSRFNFTKMSQRKRVSHPVKNAVQNISHYTHGLAASLSTKHSVRNYTYLKKKSPKQTISESTSCCSVHRRPAANMRNRCPKVCPAAFHTLALLCCFCSLIQTLLDLSVLFCIYEKKFWSATDNATVNKTCVTGKTKDWFDTQMLT